MYTTLLSLRCLMQKILSQCHIIHCEDKQIICSIRSIFYYQIYNKTRYSPWGCPMHVIPSSIWFISRGCFTPHVWILVYHKYIKDKLMINNANSALLFSATSEEMSHSFTNFQNQSFKIYHWVKSYPNLKDTEDHIYLVRGIFFTILRKKGMYE